MHRGGLLATTSDLRLRKGLAEGSTFEGGGAPHFSRVGVVGVSRRGVKSSDAGKSEGLDKETFLLEF